MKITRDLEGMATDLSKGVRSVNALSQGISLLESAALKMAPVGVTLVDRDGRYLYVNSVAAQINGLSAEEHVGRRVEEVVPAVWPVIEPLHRQMFASAEPLPGVILHGETAAQPGEEHWWQTSYYPIVMGNEVAAIAAFINDVTEARRADEARQETEARFASFMNNLPGAAWMKDRDGRYVYANKANEQALRIFTTQDNNVGKKDEDFLPEATTRQFEEHDRQALEGEVVRAVEVLPHYDGNHSYLVAKFPVAGVRGKTEYVGGIAVDITDRVRAEENLEDKSRHLEKALAELEAASKIKDDFLGMVSHELRTPITSILGNASILLRVRSILSEAEQVQSLSDLLGEATRLNQIVENLLVLARLDRGKEVDCEPVQVSKAIKRVLRDSRRRHPEREFRFQRLTVEPIAFGIEAYIEQVLRNYLSNAVKYGEPCSRIDVTLRQSENAICVRVLDRGVGLGSEDFENLFQPFYRSARTALTTSGVGIGLTVCKRLVEAQRGCVWAKPRSHGGTEFGFSLPLADEEMAPES